jgi:hypothetical protein
VLVWAEFDFDERLLLECRVELAVELELLGLFNYERLPASGKSSRSATCKDVE